MSCVFFVLVWVHQMWYLNRQINSKVHFRGLRSACSPQHNFKCPVSFCHMDKSDSDYYRRSKVKGQDQRFMLFIINFGRMSQWIKYYSNDSESQTVLIDYHIGATQNEDVAEKMQNTLQTEHSERRGKVY